MRDNKAQAASIESGSAKQSPAQSGTKSDQRNDIDPKVLARLRKLTPYGSILDELVAISRHHFGWYTRQQLRSLEYPWTAAQAGDVTGKHLVDVGAGISPLPLWFADRCASVTTIDYFPKTTTTANLKAANEWGFLDYADLRSNMRSLNADASSLELERPVDVVYSVSVIEHMPAAVRRGVIRNAANWLVPGGLLIITTDLVSSSTRLWNRDQGKVVESPEDHGGVEDLKQEISDAGFKIDNVETVRRFNEEIGDLLMLKAVKKP